MNPTIRQAWLKLPPSDYTEYTRVTRRVERRHGNLAQTAVCSSSGALHNSDYTTLVTVIFGRRKKLECLSSTREQEMGVPAHYGFVLNIRVTTANLL